MATRNSRRRSKNVIDLESSGDEVKWDAPPRTSHQRVPAGDIVSMEYGKKKNQEFLDEQKKAKRKSADVEPKGPKGPAGC
eukprot:COSAG02_NODE_249_length_27097_cov_30.179155_18_plen_80_part_00